MQGGAGSSRRGRSGRVARSPSIVSHVFVIGRPDARPARVPGFRGINLITGANRCEMERNFDCSVTEKPCTNSRCVLGSCRDEIERSVKVKDMGAERAVEDYKWKLIEDILG